MAPKRPFRVLSIGTTMWKPAPVVPRSAVTAAPTWAWAEAPARRAANAKTVCLNAMLEKPFSIEQPSIVKQGLTFTEKKRLPVTAMRNGLFMPNGAGFVAAIPAPSHNVTGQWRPELIWRCPTTERTS
ncbi:hypothetical protein MASSI9I_100174 [Massilia sp. 9I]|nr:hypothetical protein MASSI9I_100174 [Massilia sp. 9I]